MRPVVTMVNSVPYLDQNGHSERTTGFGDTVSELRYPARCSGVGSSSTQARRFIFPPRPRSERLARTHGSSLRRVVPEHLLCRVRDLLVATPRLVGWLDVTAGQAPPHDRACPCSGDVDDKRSDQNRLNPRRPPPVCTETKGTPPVGRTGDFQVLVKTRVVGN